MNAQLNHCFETDMDFSVRSCLLFISFSKMILSFCFSTVDFKPFPPAKNDGNKYDLVALRVHDRRVFARALDDKTPELCAATLREMWAKSDTRVTFE